MVFTRVIPALPPKYGCVRELPTYFAMRPAAPTTVELKATPLETFEVFTQEIGLWWKPNGLFQLTPGGDGQLRFEPGEGGRLVTDMSNGRTFEIGRISVWAPGERLSFSWRQGTFAPEQSTHVDARFEAAGEDETRVTVEHRGWDSVPPEHVVHAYGFLFREEEVIRAVQVQVVALRCARVGDVDRQRDGACAKAETCQADR